MTWGRSTTASPGLGPVKPRSRAHSFFLPSRSRRMHAAVGASGAVPAIPTETLPGSSAFASTSYTTTTERSADHDTQPPQSPWWPDAVRVKPRRRSAQTTANNDGRVQKRDEGDEFTCCGLSASLEADGRADDDDGVGPSGAVLARSANPMHNESYLQAPDEAFYRAQHHLAMASKPVTITADPLVQLYNHDEDSLDMADLLDNTLIPMVMSPYVPRSTAMSAGSSASTFEASPRTPTVSPPFRTTAMPAPPAVPVAMTSTGSLERSARHARSMPSLGLAFRSARRKRPIEKGEAAEAALPAATITTTTTTTTAASSLDLIGSTAPLSIVPKQKREAVVGGAEQMNALQLVMGSPALEAGEFAPLSSHRLRRPTEAPALSQTSPLRARRHKPPLTIAPLSSAAVDVQSPASDASTPLLSPSTPTSGTLRARRSKASLKVFTVSSPPPCPPPTTPLPQLPPTPTVKNATNSDGHRQSKATAYTMAAAAMAKAVEGSAERVAVTPTSRPSMESKRMSAAGHGPTSIDMRGTGRALSTASSSSVQSKVTHSSPHFSMRSYESYQTSPASVTKIDSATQSAQQLVATTGQQSRQPTRHSLLDRYTPRSSIGLRDSRQSMTSIAMLVGDESTMASNGNHATLSKTTTPAAGSDRSSVGSDVSSSSSGGAGGFAAVDEPCQQKQNETLADAATRARTPESDERIASQGRGGAKDDVVIGLAF